MKKRSFWTSEQLQLLKELYPDTPTRQLCAVLNKSARSIYSQAKVYGLKKSDEYMNSPNSGRLLKGVRRSKGTEFKKGQKAWNKGVKLGRSWVKGNMEKTLFKKGQVPLNTLFDGAESIRNSKGRPYIWVRISVGVWREKHRLVWEQANGPIPAGCNVQFKDGNSLNCTLENLYLIDRHKQMAQNTIARYPTDLRNTMRLLKKLNRKIKTYEKQD